MMAPVSIDGTYNLRVQCGDVLIVRLPRDDFEQKAPSAVSCLRAMLDLVGHDDVPIIAMVRDIDLEVIGPRAGRAMREALDQALDAAAAAKADR